MAIRLVRHARIWALGVCAAIAVTAASVPAASGASAPSHRTAAPAGTDRSAPAAVPAQRRADVLGHGWQSAHDMAWTTVGDGDGLHLLVADESTGYAWRTAATLSEPSFEADAWIGNACLTASGRRAVVVYAPRTFTNKPALFDRGAFTAVVDLQTGAVRKLPITTTLAYFNPGCGAGEDAVLTQAGDQDRNQTGLLRLDAATGALDRRIVVAGQLTSPVPTRTGIAAADSGAIVSVDRTGARRVLAPARGVPFKLAADSDGGVTYLERSGGQRVLARRLALGTRRVSTLVSGPLTHVDVSSGRGGRVFVTGTGTVVAHPAVTRNVTVARVPVGSQLSTDGELAVSSVVHSHQPDPRAPAPDPAGPQPVTVHAVATATGAAVTLAAMPATPMAGAQGPNAGRAPSPALRGTARPRSRGASPLDGPTGPADPSARYCSVPRNDPANQAMQPKPRQVEWAVDQAVRGVLTVSRPANWKNLAMPSYTPQGLFPAHPISGGGNIPAQVMLGIAAQESNLWQAARFAVPGVTANPLIGNYYGVDIYNDDSSDDWTIHWSDADCGYGVTQVTDGMRLAGRTKPGETALPYQTQRAVALDFAANIAAGVQKLEDKWNETRAAGMTVNNGDPAKIENWYYAVWDYNSGFHPNTGSGPWGVGWANNPANPHYPANRTPFLDGNNYADAAHPQDWSYPEKVMGWAAWPIQALESPNTFVPGYRAAYWNGGAAANGYRSQVSPPHNQFCTPTFDDCHPGEKYVPSYPGNPPGGQDDVRGEPAGPCAHQTGGLYDLKCWSHGPATWKNDCPSTCGNELLRFDPGYAYQDDGTAYPPRCDLSGLPSNAQIVDDVPDGTPVVRPNCGRPWSNAGTFTLSYQDDGTGNYPGKIDTHQLGAGFGGHFWFTHTRTSTDTGGKLEVDADWKLKAKRTGPMRILVALPDHGAQTNHAQYVVKTSNGDRVRTVRQPAGDGNRWFNLGAFMFDNIPEVTLNSVTADGDGSQDIAFDALAFVPITGTYKEQSVESVAEFDEDQNIDTSKETSWLAGPLADRQSLYGWAQQNAGLILGLTPCTGGSVTKCQTPALKSFATTWDGQVKTAGTDPVNHPDGSSIGDWIAFAQPYTDRPTSTTRPSWFDNDDHFKIRLKTTVSYVVDSSNKIVAGSEYAAYQSRAGNSHLPQFVRNLFTAVQSSYGIAPPDMRYRARDLNAHNGGYTSVDPVANGIMPGRAYAAAGKAPVAVDSSGAPSTANATCVATLSTGGGSIGYRPLIGQSGPAANWQSWVSRLKNDTRVPAEVSDLAESIRAMFFDAGTVPGVTASIFGQAPPIWQELNFMACTDGTIKPISGRPLLRESYMPDQYLYHNGVAMTANGGTTTSTQPVTKGDFAAFSRAPSGDYEDPYGPCDSATDRAGNPWDITAVPPADADTDPAHGHFCLDRSLAIDPAYSD